MWKKNERGLEAQRNQPDLTLIGDTTGHGIPSVKSGEGQAIGPKEEVQ